jgi:hypothetical protein
VTPPALELDSLETVAAGGGRSLVRVAARWHAGDELALPAPVLVVRQAGRARRVALLPGPDTGAISAGADPAPWRGAFAVPDELLVDAVLAL